MPRVRVLKVAHHGSWNGTSEAWAARTRPEAAVISLGATNSYGHPAPQVLALWAGVGATVYRTDRDGTTCRAISGLFSHDLAISPDGQHLLYLASDRRGNEQFTVQERAGVPRSVAMKLPGHRTEAIYRRYAIVAMADLREGVARLARLDGANDARKGTVRAQSAGSAG